MHYLDGETKGSAQEKPMVFSFFSGSGLLDLGFEDAGFEIGFVNEFNPAFLNAYKFSREKLGYDKPRFGYHCTNIIEYLDSRSQELEGYLEQTRKTGRKIGFVGGPPCPDFSIGGKNKGQHGDNGVLSLSYVQLINRMKPDFFLFENVKGLWRTKKHRVFYENLKGILISNGYRCTDRLSNALESGVPQDRERILLFGIKEELVNDFYLDGVKLSDFPWTSHFTYSDETLSKAQWPDTDSFTKESELEAPPGIIQELSVEHWFKKNDVDSHPNASAYFKPRGGADRINSIAEGDVSKKSFKRLHRWRYSPTAAYGNNEVHLHPYKARRISAAEALAIQSLPRGFQLPPDMSLSAMFKTIGNGVPYLLSRAIAYSIYDYLEVALCKD